MFTPAIMVLKREILRLTSAIAIVLAAIAVLLLPQMASAQGFKGAQPAFLDGGDIFSFSGDTLTVTATSTPVEVYNLNKNGTKGTLMGQLLGISGIWIITPTGQTITAASGDGNLYGTVNKKTVTTSWTAESGPAGYEGASGYPANGKGTWLDLVSLSTLQLFGKSQGTSYTSGMFSFPGLTNLNGNDEIGIDYLVGTTTGMSHGTITGRLFMNAPEPGTIATFSIVGVALGGLMFAARRRRRLSA